MKFLCDRCKTRYSIGDDRVRGKILKIRCKNCANVITVREGMPEVADAAPAPAEPRRQRTTTQAPMPMATVGAGASSGGNALGAAFASAMTKPPPALEEEWYVSIDGEQAGPFSLAEAQRWVAGKAFDADLHCWSEGFDDWLPVDKVSHFRGLRKKPAPPAAPPPLPRVGSGPSRANTMSARAVEATVEEEPKPLFAATMASLEKAAGLSGPASPGGAQPLPTPRVPLEPSRPIAKPNGPAVSQRPSATPPTGQPALKNGSHAAPTVPSKSFGFDASEAAAESATQIEAQPFDDEASTAAEPVAATARRIAGQPTKATEPATALPASSSAPTTPMRSVESARPFPAPKPAPEPAVPERPMFSASQPLAAKHPFVDSGEQPTLRAPAPPPPAQPAAKAPDATIEDDEPDGLDIGEVSRVVKLADLMRAQPSHKAAQKRTGAVPLIATNTSVNTALGRTGSVPKLPMPLAEAVDAPVNPVAPPADLLPNDPAAHAVVATHRRGLIMLLIGAAVLIGVAVVVVVMMINKSRTTIVENLGSNFEFDGQRPDQLVFRDPKDPNPTPGTDTQGSGAKKPPYTPWKNPNTNPNTTRPVDPPPGNTLKAEEVEEMAAKNSGTTQMCWRRSQRGADGILLADVKKMTVTLTVSPDGGVADVQLSDNHAQNNLGKCLMGAIRSWKFRPSGGGTFRFVLHFG